MAESNYISIKGAKVNNLKNIDVDIPRNKLVVITGLSGSGKSSLAFDTLYADGFRYFCNVDSAKHWVQIHDGYVRQGRRNIDGYRMYYQPNLLDDLFDTKTVWDDARPTPVPKI